MQKWKIVESKSKGLISMDIGIDDGDKFHFIANIRSKEKPLKVDVENAFKNALHTRGKDDKKEIAWISFSTWFDEVHTQYCREKVEEVTYERRIQLV